MSIFKDFFESHSLSFSQHDWAFLFWLLNLIFCPHKGLSSEKGLLFPWLLTFCRPLLTVALP